MARFWHEAEVLGALNRHIVAAFYGIADPYHFRNFGVLKPRGANLAERTELPQAVAQRQQV